MLVLIFVTAGGVLLYTHTDQPAVQSKTAQECLQVRQETDSFIAAIRAYEAARQAQHRTQAYDRIRRPAPERFAFDPNTADSTTLQRLGLPGWMARNVLKYREKGGRFRQAEDFRKIYGLTEEQYQALKPYIQIQQRDEHGQGQKRDSALQPIQLYRPPAKDSTRIAFKYPLGTKVSLNGADTTELKKIPGIGSGIARMITGYRRRLGGFYRIEQLAEIHLDYDKLKPWFEIEPDSIRRINLNKAGVERLRNHPYINFYQAKAIVEYRRKNGPLHNLKVFALYEEFTREDLERIGHYVCFE